MIKVTRLPVIGKRLIQDPIKLYGSLYQQSYISEMWLYREKEKLRVVIDYIFQVLRCINFSIACNLNVL